MGGSDRLAIREWTREQVEKYQCMLPAYVQYADTLRRVLEHAAAVHAPLAVVQTRPKAIASFAEKIQRKRGKYRDPVNQLTDLCGGRVITSTAGDVAPMCRFIEAHFDIDWANSVDVTQRLKPAEFGYRSVHYIVQFRPGVFPADLTIFTGRISKKRMKEEHYLEYLEMTKPPVIPQE